MKREKSAMSDGELDQRVSLQGTTRETTRVLKGLTWSNAGLPIFGPLGDILAVAV
jgi:hypothetical protein